ncbi:EamA family transporter [Enterobacter hormaechei]
MLAGLRFLLAAFPALLFVARRKFPSSCCWATASPSALVSLRFFFALLNSVCLRLASLVLQVQAFFTIILGAFVFGERLQGKQLAGISLAVFGVLVLIEGSLNGQHVALLGFMLTLGGGAQLGVRQYL